MQVESKRGSVVECHVYEDGEPANQCMDNSRMAQPGPSFIPLSVCAHLLQEGCLRGAAERCRAGYKAFVCMGLCSKMRWCSADKASDPACK